MSYVNPLREITISATQAQAPRIKIQVDIAPLLGLRAGARRGGKAAPGSLLLGADGDRSQTKKSLNVTAIAPAPPTSAEAEVVLPVGVGGIPGARNRRRPAALVSTGGSPAAIMGWAQHRINTIVTKYRTHGRTGPDLLVSRQTPPFMPPEH
jgi:hypothetical protein